MFGLGLTELIILLMLLPLVVVPVWAAWRVSLKAGFRGAWGFLVIVPVVSLIALWVFAFVDWPATSDEASNSQSMV
jgi:uncharacterized membrane protein